MRTILALVLCLLQCPLLAHPETPVAEHGGTQFDCEHPPAAAVRSLPEALVAFSDLACSQYGQFMTAAPGWHWRFPGSYFVVPTIPAFTPTVSDGPAGPRFFSTLSIRKLSVEEVERRHADFAETVPTYSPAQVPQTMLQLSALNDLGKAFDVYFSFESPERAWAVTCAPQCAPEYVFMINRQVANEQE